MRTSWNDDEDSALHGLPWIAQLIYLRAIRPYLDYSNGIVGIQRGISLKSMAEMLHVESGQGRSDWGDPSQKAVRCAIELLERAGLLIKIPADRKLIFELPLADRDDSAQKKWGRRRADVGQTKQGTENDSADNDMDDKRGIRGADHQGEKWGTPPLSVIRIEDNPPYPPVAKPRKPSKRTTSTWTLPPGIAQDIWEEFEKHRADIRKPLTDNARTKNAEVLRQLSPEQQRAIVDTTIRSGWTGLFAPKVNGSQYATAEKPHARIQRELTERVASHDWSDTAEVD